MASPAKGCTKTATAEELKHGPGKLCKATGFFPQQIRKYLAISAMCICVLNKYSQRARIQRDFVVCTGWDRKARGRWQITPLIDRAADGASLPQPGETGGTALAASKADFMLLYCKRVTDRILPTVFPGATDSQAQHKNYLLKVFRMQYQPPEINYSSSLHWQCDTHSLPN